jgi:hypothetical protein
MRFNDGSIYHGDFYMGERYGNGIQILNGMLYVGMFSCDQFHGHGVLSATRQDGQTTITDGCWVRGVLNGWGSVLNTTMQRHYEGKFVCGALRGCVKETDMVTGRSWLGMF